MRIRHELLLDHGRFKLATSPSTEKIDKLNDPALVNAAIDARWPRSFFSERSVPHKTCIVTAEAEAVPFDRGIGTANRALAETLRALGCDVDILYTRVDNRIPFNLPNDHVASYQTRDIRHLHINYTGNQSHWQAISHLALQHLLRHHYDLVFFDDLYGTGYYPLVARRTGNEKLRTTTMCVTAHGSTQWYADAERRIITSFESLPLLEMERRSVELADAIKAPSAYILKKYSDWNWALPNNSIVIPNFVSTFATTSRPQRQTPIKEIVFFGRLENRKALWIFCRALDRLKYKLSSHQVTFLGNASCETAGELIQHSARWPFPIRLSNTFDQQQAFSYLKGEGRLTVMCSLEDNGPSVVINCIEEGISFLASSGSGAEELIDAEGRNAVLFEPTVDGLCKKLVDVLENGVSTARSTFDREHLHNSFSKWLEGLLRSDAAKPRSEPERSLLPKPILVVTVPSGFDANQCLTDLEQIVDAYNGEVIIELISENPVELQLYLEPKLYTGAVNLTDLKDFSNLARSIADREETILGLCHITQMLPERWIERARDCFAVKNGISAVTGMAKTKKAENTECEDGLADGPYKITRYSIGYAPALFALAQETNCGFVLMRSNLFALISTVSPVDEQYNRLKRMEHWIHEILVTLYRDGRRFELLPDIDIEKLPQEVPFELNRLAPFMRSLARKLYAPGSDQYLLTRMVIDQRLSTQSDFEAADQ